MPPNANEDISLSLPKERKQTDKSLEAEREKADAVLLAEKRRTQQEADQAISHSRAEADQLRIRVRHDADRSRVKEDSIKIEERVIHEREVVDEALAIERGDIDAILDEERRGIGSEERGFFRAERKETDENLTKERIKTDVEVHRATAALTTRDEFLAIVSHDLRNPLGSIAMAAESLVGMPFYGAADEDTRDFIEIISRNAGEALRLIGDLMDMDRVAAGKLSLQIESHNINEIIRTSVNSFQSHALKKSIDLATHIDGKASLMVRCDRDRISQVLSNLIGNAIKFTPIGGAISLASQILDDGALISITDSGPGISEDMLSKVFGRFLQIGRNDRRGLGLGLYISKMIVEAHGGRIWVDSKLGHGSTFHFKI